MIDKEGGLQAGSGHAGGTYSYAMMYWFQSLKKATVTA